MIDYLSIEEKRYHGYSPTASGEDSIEFVFRIRVSDNKAGQRAIALAKARIEGLENELRERESE